MGTCEARLFVVSKGNPRPGIYSRIRGEERLRSCFISRPVDVEDRRSDAPAVVVHRLHPVLEVPDLLSTFFTAPSDFQTLNQVEGDDDDDD